MAATTRGDPIALTAALAGVIATIAAYAVGLGGSFVLDDDQNFTQLERFARGEIDWWGVLVSNNSGPLGRPLSMATFVASAAAGGHSPWVYKVGNLGLHITCGALFAILAMQLQRCAGVAERTAARFAAFLLCAWLLLPMHASTVLYAVQRMAQMSSLFVLLGAITFVAARQQLAAGDARRGTLTLWVLVPALTVLGAFAKENGAVLPLVCLAIELAWFAGRPHRAASTFFVATIALPALCLAGILAYRPDLLLGGYASRDFTVSERLMTQPVVLWDYVRNIVVPYAPSMGIVQDDFPVSRGPLDPPWTLAAAAAWLVVIFLALSYRRRAPLVAGGVLLFLAGHGVESTFLPLEIYFEHRNYLPSMGILLALAGAGQAAGPMIARATPAFRGALAVLLLLFVASLTWATHGRARVWSEPNLLLVQALHQRPDSPRANLMMVGASLTRGDAATARRFLARAELNLPDKRRAAVDLVTLMIACVEQQPPEQIRLERIATLGPPTPDTTVLQSAIALEDLVVSRRCPSIGPVDLAAAYLGWSGRLAVPPGDMRSWRIRFMAARLLAQGGRVRDAVTLIERAWIDSGYNVGVGITTARLFEAIADKDGLSRTVKQMRASVPHWDRTAWLEIERLERQLEMLSTRSTAPISGS